ncbi:MAG: hypothetical protein PHO18_04760 [Synergistaceae bacterium]|nr:hypothetical protein [Synergistaceae bacterium]
MEQFPRTPRNISLFVIPSTLGICAFLLPFEWHGTVNTLIGHGKEYLLDLLKDQFGNLVLIVSLLTMMLSVAATSIRPEWIMKNQMFKENLICNPFWFVARFASIPIAMVALWGNNEMFGFLFKDAQLIVLNLAPKLIVLTFIMSLTAPMLMDFGLVQFVAVYASPVMRPLFKVPGRSAVDCIASWLGSSSMAVVITAKMHNAGYYSDREAAVMVTSFSLTGIYNIYAIATLLDFRYAFPQIVFSVYLTMFLLALIFPRIWPLTSIPETYHGGADNYDAPPQEARHGHSLFDWALLRGISKARHMNIRLYFHETFSIAIPLLFGTIPLMITFGTLLLSIADVTPLLDIIAYPISLLLEKLGAPEAQILGGVSVFAFIDQYLAIAYAQVLFSEAGRFLCICLVTIGLINLTEIGIHVWHSSIPITFWQMTVIYVMRIVMSLFIIIPLSLLFFS